MWKETVRWQKHLQCFGGQKHLSFIVRGEDADLNATEAMECAQRNEGSTVKFSVWMGRGDWKSKDKE